MRCPSCDQATQVIDSRESDNNIRRRRECLSCQARFTTYERIEMPKISVIKRDGRREPFSRDKLTEGLRKACEKRPICLTNLEAIVFNIEQRLNQAGHSEVQSVEIGEMVMQALQTLDGVAYIRFASVYRQFTDIQSLQAAVSDLTNQDRPGGRKNQSPAHKEGHG